MISDPLLASLTSIFESSPLKPEKLREVLQSGREEITRQFHDGVSARQLLRARSDLIDSTLQGIWQLIGPNSPQTALVAVGGYGRRELHPFSDIDLLILAEDSDDPATSSAISTFVTILWDLGLEIGHSVRSIAQCVDEGRADITITTNLLEARLLSGSAEFFNQLQHSISDDSIWPSGPFFIAKRNEQHARLEKYNDTAYNLEPNIKEGPGGLRDIQNILWVTRRHFGATNLDRESGTLRELVDHHFLTTTECADLEAGQERLWEIRFALHLIAGRAEERLLFEYQPELAQYFGHLDSGHNRSVESFMHSYFRIIRELSLLNEILLQLFEEQLLTPDSEKQPLPVDDNFGSSGGYLTLLDQHGLEREPSLILSLFLILRDHPEIKGVAAETIRQVRAARHTIDPKFRNNPRHQQHFLQLFYQPEGLTHQLRRMNRYGVLGAYLPDFEKIIGLMQYDLFHAYTVDEHTLFVVRNLRRLTIPEFHHEAPQLSKLIAELQHPEQIYLAALFHDIAKGRGGDHSKLGVEVAKNFCKQHQVDSETTTEISWLIENHLIMSAFAQRNDIDDPAEIHTFANMVKQQSRLDMLYLLTVADIRATNSTLWNHFKDSLLSHLYNSTSEALERGLSQPEDSDERGVENRKQALELLDGDGINNKQAESLWEELDDEYFQKHDAREISWHTRSILGNQQYPLIRFHRKSHHGGSEILIYSRDQQFLFPILVHAMESLGLNIQTAKINTTLNSYALNIFTVLDRDGKTVQDEKSISRIKQTLHNEIEHPTLLAQPVTFRKTRHQKHFHEESEVQFQQDESKQQTILEIHATDRPGLLSTICRILMNCNIRIHGAKIATLGEKVEDLFWVTHQDNTPLTRQKENDRLSEQLKQALDPQ